MPSQCKLFRQKPYKPKEIQTNERLVNMMKSVLVRLINLDMAHNRAT
jgi:hypothetical protein